MAANGEQVRTWPFSKHYPDICLEGKESKFSGMMIIIITADIKSI
jgi:hypothetical protein